MIAPAGDPPEIAVRPAQPEDAGALSRVAYRAKAHWGYDARFMELCRDELTVTPARIEAGGVWLAEAGGAPIGFVSLLAMADGATEIGHLFVDPPWIGRGVGRQLAERAFAEARARGLGHLLVDSDPNAEAFYARIGFVRIGWVPSGSIPGRSLPRMRIALPAARDPSAG